VYNFIVSGLIEYLSLIWESMIIIFEGNNIIEYKIVIIIKIMFNGSIFDE